MASTVRVEGLDRLVADLDKAISTAIPEITGVLSKGAFNIKKDWQGSWKGLKHAPALPYAVTYDIVVTPGAISAEIGPDKDRRQGALGNLLEYGSINNAPHPGGSPALDTEAPKFEAALDALTEKLFP